MLRAHGSTGALTGLVGVMLGALVLTIGLFNAGVSAPPATAQSSSCGDSIVEPGEECDPPGSSCTGTFAGGTCQNDCTCSSPTPALLRHFQCYHIRPPQAVTPVTVTLEDQFNSFSATTKKASTVCAPADKNGEDPGGSADPAHLVSYAIRPGARTPKVFNQTVTNQFGTVNVDALKPARLMVPSFKSLTGPPSSPAPGLLDHFSCYKVKRTAGTPKFVRRSVTITTQFETASIDLTRPLRLCAPVNKNGEDPSAPNNPDPIPNHLLCYRARSSGGIANTGVFVNNQFGQQSYTLSQRREFCVPSIKGVFSHSSTTSTSTSTTTSPPSTASTSSTSTTSTSTSTASGGSTTTTTSSTTLIAITTTSTSTSLPTTTIPGCCSNTLLQFTTTAGVESCGQTVNASGTVQTTLACGGLYTGSGNGTVPQPFVVPDLERVFTAVTSCNATTGAITLGPTADPGGTSITALSHRTCTSVGCLFGAPLPIPNTTTTAISLCVINRVATAASGTTSCLTGASSINLPLSAELFVGGDLEPAAGIQACPTCQGGTCQSGANSGGACVPADSNLGPSGPTSHDCPPLAVQSIGFLPIPFALTTGSTTRTAVSMATQQRVFCGFCHDNDLSGVIGNGGFGKCVGGVNNGSVCDTTTTCVGGTCAGAVACASDAQCPPPGDVGFETREACRQAGLAAGGAFQKAAANTITESGTAAGDLTDGLAHPSTLVSIFCIPPTFDGAVDSNGGLPGPGAVALSGEAQLVP